MATTASPSLLPSLPPKAREIPATIRSNPLAEPLPRPSWRAIFRVAIVVVVLAWAWNGTGITPGALIEGLQVCREGVLRLVIACSSVCDHLDTAWHETQRKRTGTKLTCAILPSCLESRSTG